MLRTIEMYTNEYKDTHKRKSERKKDSFLHRQRFR